MTLTDQKLLIQCLEDLKIISSNKTTSFLPYTIVNVLQEKMQLSTSELGLHLLPFAADFAVAPVSHFHVGAVAFDNVGNAYLGANFEFADTHIGQTIHAEQSAIANAWAHGATELALLVINYAPCGHCRQFINEVKLTENFLIQLPEMSAKPLSHYLPDAFGAKDLGIDEYILGKKSTEKMLDLTTLSPLANFSTEKKQDDPVLNKVITAYKQAHAPYSGSKSSIALVYTDGEIITGQYAENAAFNPSLPALQMALNTRRLQGKDWKAIKRAVMVESATSLQQKENTKSLLKTMSDSDLEYHSVHSQ